MVDLCFFLVRFVYTALIERKIRPLNRLLNTQQDWQVLRYFQSVEGLIQQQRAVVLTFYHTSDITQIVHSICKPEFLKIDFYIRMNKWEVQTYQSNQKEMIGQQDSARFFCLRCLIFLKFMFAQDAFLHWVRKKEKKVNKCKKHIAFASVNTHQKHVGSLSWRSEKPCGKAFFVDNLTTRITSHVSKPDPAQLSTVQFCKIIQMMSYELCILKIFCHYNCHCLVSWVLQRWNTFR